MEIVCSGYAAGSVVATSHSKLWREASTVPFIFLIGLNRHGISGLEGVTNSTRKSPCVHNLLTPSSISVTSPTLMEQPKQTKEKVREYLERRQVERRQNTRAPLHGPEQIRQEIGWDMVERRQGNRRRQ